MNKIGEMKKLEGQNHLKTAGFMENPAIILMMKEARSEFSSISHCTKQTIGFQCMSHQMLLNILQAHKTLDLETPVLRNVQNLVLHTFSKMLHRAAYHLQQSHYAYENRESMLVNQKIWRLPVLCS
mmetsp:Transcript_27315/g.35452  ORF Transcript_27315/g.35452 Transcript_27315/m.35452 type:complete len:126 (+) Transcript_27315:230-607(+)